MTDIQTQLSDGTLTVAGSALVSGLAENVSLVPNPQGVGAFLRFAAPKAESRHVLPVGAPAGVARWTACHRYEPFWMRAKAGTRLADVPVETQSLLVEREDGSCVLLVPLLDSPFRCALQGGEGETLALVAETGDPATAGSDIVGLFVASGADPFELMERAARSVMAQMGTGRLRREKSVPNWVDQFGWCTWDSFYQDVDPAKVRVGLESFREGGVSPRLLILDDGWQSERAFPQGERRLTSFAANEKFDGDLAPLVQEAKGEFGVKTFLVWHALHGYWGGVDGESLPGYGVRSLRRRYSPGIHHYYPDGIPWFGPAAGVVPGEHVYRFFQDYHRRLRLQGVDGVKVDNQAALEGLADGLGGRVELMRQYHEALEGSCQTHFAGNLINCMSCASDMLYSALASNVTRTSTDFWPNDPASHGLHLYVNAQVSAWFGEFIFPDWDMFQSGHAMGAYHAAGRAVGGCPVYVSDKPDAHDFALLRKLVLPDGSILRADGPGRPTRDCLFRDPTTEDVLLKIWNRNGDAGVLGVFHARWGAEGQPAAPIVGTVRPSAVPGLDGERFAVFAHHADELRVLGREDAWDLTLDQLTCEVFTVVPIQNGLAPIGLADLFNSAGAVTAKHYDAAGAYEVALRDGGRFLAWSERAPVRVEASGVAIPFAFGPDTGRLQVDVPVGGPVTVRFFFG